MTFKITVHGAKKHCGLCGNKYTSQNPVGGYSYTRGTGKGQWQCKRCTPGAVMRAVPIFQFERRTAIERRTS